MTKEIELKQFKGIITNVNDFESKIIRKAKLNFREPNPAFDFTITPYTINFLYTQLDSLYGDRVAKHTDEVIIKRLILNISNDLPEAYMNMLKLNPEFMKKISVGGAFSNTSINSLKNDLDPSKKYSQNETSIIEAPNEESPFGEEDNEEVFSKTINRSAFVSSKTETSDVVASYQSLNFVGVSSIIEEMFKKSKYDNLFYNDNANDSFKLVVVQGEKGDKGDTGSAGIAGTSGKGVENIDFDKIIREKWNINYDGSSDTIISFDNSNQTGITDDNKTTYNVNEHNFVFYGITAPQHFGPDKLYNGTGRIVSANRIETEDDEGNITGKYTMEIRLLEHLYNETHDSFYLVETYFTFDTELSNWSVIEYSQNRKDLDRSEVYEKLDWSGQVQPFIDAGGYFRGTNGIIVDTHKWYSIELDRGSYMIGYIKESSTGTIDVFNHNMSAFGIEQSATGFKYHDLTLRWNKSRSATTWTLTKTDNVIFDSTQINNDITTLKTDTDSNAKMLNRIKNTFSLTNQEKFSTSNDGKILQVKNDGTIEFVNKPTGITAADKKILTDTEKRSKDNDVSLTQAQNFLGVGNGFVAGGAQVGKIPEVQADGTLTYVDKPTGISTADKKILTDTEARSKSNETKIGDNKADIDRVSDNNILSTRWISSFDRRNTVPLKQVSDYYDDGHDFDTDITNYSQGDWSTILRRGGTKLATHADGQALVVLFGDELYAKMRQSTESDFSNDPYDFFVFRKEGDVSTWYFRESNGEYYQFYYDSDTSASGFSEEDGSRFPQEVKDIFALPIFTLAPHNNILSFNTPIHNPDKIGEVKSLRNLSDSDLIRNVMFPEDIVQNRDMVIFEAVNNVDVNIVGNKPVNYLRKDNIFMADNAVELKSIQSGSDKWLEVKFNLKRAMIGGRYRVHVKLPRTTTGDKNNIRAFFKGLVTNGGSRREFGSADSQIDTAGSWRNDTNGRLLDDGSNAAVDTSQTTSWIIDFAFNGTRIDWSLYVERFGNEIISTASSWRRRYVFLSSGTAKKADGSNVFTTEILLHFGPMNTNFGKVFGEVTVKKTKDTDYVNKLFE